MAAVYNPRITNANVGGMVMLANQYVGCIFPSLAAANAGSYSQTGNTITVTSTAHNIPNAPSPNGKDVYLNLGVAATGSTIPAGVFTNFQYVDANTFTCQSTVSQTGTGTAVVTQTSAITLPQVNLTVPGGLMGLNGFLEVYNFGQCNATAGTKRMAFSYGGFVFKNPSPAVSTLSIGEMHRLQNVNSQSKQMAMGTSLGSYVNNSTLLPIVASINSAVDQLITATVTLNTASDFITLEHFGVTVFPG